MTLNCTLIKIVEVNPNIPYVKASSHNQITILTNETEYKIDV